MSPYLTIIVVVLIPTAIGYGVIGSARVLRWAGNWRRSRIAVPEPEPIERLAGNLRRLRAELEAIENSSGIPNKRFRIDALRGAYLDALANACRRLEVAPPAVVGPPVSPRANQAEIYRVEAALRQRGLDVREPAAH